jgi:diguanylate cyclase (GGDEF) domain
VWSNEQQQRLRAALIRAEMLQFERDAELLRAHNQALAQSNEEKVALLAQLEAQRGHLERLSLEDPLTGLANRRSLDTQLDRELARAERFGHPLSIAMLDVDHFKSVNDDYSHTTGDAVLRAIAACLRVRTRSVDVVARYGGEEFVMLFAETSLDDSRRVAEELRAAVESADWSELVPGRSVTVSIGVAASTERPTARGLLALADARLYEAKAQGRNRVR